MTVAIDARAFVRQWTRPARRRSAVIDGMAWLPVAVVAAVVAWRWQGIVAAVVVAACVCAAVGLVAGRRARRFDQGWIVGQLDARRRDMEDSTGLLFVADDRLSPLQRLQRQRLAARLDAPSVLDLRAPWPVRRIALSWIAAALVAAVIFGWPSRRPHDAITATDARVVPRGPPRVIGQRLRIVPPAYTGLPPRVTDRLDATVPAGSSMTWTVRVAPPPAGVDIVPLDGDRIALTRDGDTWTATRRVDRSMLYRLVPRGSSGEARLHRIDVVPDAPPAITTIIPDRSLTLMTTGLRRWALAFEASDDHGVAVAAQLRLTVASGEGENISFRERTVPVIGTGTGRKRRFAARIDLAAIGFAVGNDLVAQLVVSDRAPVPHVVRSDSLILRWPVDLGTESAGLEGMMRATLPAYFRSQRQIIIDAEALVKARRAIPPARFAARSDTIGVDQRALRLRYGQFLGEKAESEAKPPPPTNDAPATPVTQTPPHSDDDGHNHAPRQPQGFGGGLDVLADYGHAHGDADTASALDPQTAATLRRALDAMWQSELSLRQGQPREALPHAYAALRFIKQVQQATRIFLSRTGPDLPPIDPARRLTGKREGLAAPALAVVPREADTGVPAAAWRALGEPTRRAVPLAALKTWLRGPDAGAVDRLAFAAAIDAVERDPGCAMCRDALRRQLWTIVRRPPASVARRDTDATGQRYFDALRAAE